MKKISKIILNNYYFNNDGERYQIIEIISSTNINIKFSDGTIRKNIQSSSIVSGAVRHPLYNQIAKKILGIACLGVGKYKFKLSRNKNLPRTDLWFDLINKVKYNFLEHDISLLWTNYQNFSKWYEENYSNDLIYTNKLIDKNNIVHSENYSIFVPKEIFDLIDNKFLNKQQKVNVIEKYRSNYKNHIIESFILAVI